MSKLGHSLSRVGLAGALTATVLVAGEAVTPSAIVGASTGESCPAGSVAHEFYWERADGSGAAWPIPGGTGATFPSFAGGSDQVDTNSGFNQTYPVGTSGVNVVTTITDLGNMNEDGDNSLSQNAPQVAGGSTNNLPDPPSISNWDEFLGTRTKGAYGLDYLTLAMTSINDTDEVVFEFEFDKPVLIPEFEIGDIDYVGTAAPEVSANRLHDSFQDEVQMFVERGGNDVLFDFLLTNGSTPSLTSSPVLTAPQTVAGGPYTANASQFVSNLNPNDAAGTVILQAQAPVNSFGFRYSNGPDDLGDRAALNETGIPGVSDTATGVSNNHAIRISSFTVCVGVLSIGDTVYADLDGDGVQDPGEPGIPGVTIDLTDPDGNVIDTIVTGPNGDYSFADLPPNNNPADPFAYVVDVDQGTLPGGTTWTPTGDNFPGDPTNDGTSQIPLTPGDPSVTTADFAFQPLPASISGHVWSDPEDDGVIGAQDTELDGVTIELLDSNGFVVATTMTVDGAYSFPNVAPDTYTIRETQPTTYADGQDVPGTNGAGTTTNDEIVVTINFGETSVDNDFFEVPGASIAGTVFEDPDDNGLQEGAPGIGGVTMTLTGTDDGGNSVTRTTTTSSTAGSVGDYSFDNLRPGTYVVTEGAVPAQYLDGQDTLGSEGGDDSVNDVFSAIVLGANVAGTDYDFAEVPLPSLSGSVLDENGDPIPGVDITLTGTVGGVPITPITTQTQPDGSYIFSDLLPGTYTVTETQPAGYGDVSTTAGSEGGTDVVENVISNITLVGGDTATDYDFVEGFSSIAGTVYEDDNNNGVQDPGEAGISGAQVTLTGTDDRGNVIDVTIQTEPDGSYLFDDLFSGPYTITEVTPPGYLDGTDAPGSTGGTAVNPGDEINSITLPIGTDATDYDFGEITPISLAGSVLDENGDPIPGVDITLTGTVGGVPITPITTQTQPDGSYIFSDLLPGTYTVTETQPAGYGDVSTTAGSEGGTDVVENVISNITLVGGDTATDYDFVEGFSSIAGTVYEDDNNNGVQDPGEAGISGAQVTLTGTDDRGNVIDVTIQTEPDGSYLFDDLFSGPYTITEVTPPGYLDGTDAPGSTGGTAVNPGDEINSITLIPNEDATDYDFGEIIPGSIAGNVRDDFGNPIGGVDITLTGTDDLGAITSITIQTEPDGSYIFPNLRPGTYTVTETQPAEYGDGPDFVGSEGGTPGNDVLSAIVIDQGTVATDYDFTETTGTISGSVAETGGANDGAPIEGVTVRLLDNNGVEVASTQTLANGTYEFTGLLAGNYSVTEDQPALYGDGPDAPGAAGGTADAPGDAIRDIPLAAGATAADNDFLEVRGSIAGHVFVDADDDGEYDNGSDVPLGGIDVTLTGTVDGNAITPITVQTQPDGSYLFPDLLAGDYTVTEGPTPGYVDGNDTAGTSGGTAGNDTTTDIPLLGGVNATDYDFGERPSAGISGNVSAVKADGSSEPIESVVVNLTGVTDAGETINLSTTTDEFGDYSFDSLLPGTYTVTEEQPAGYGQESTTAGSEGGTVSGDEISAIVLGGTTVATDYDFVEDFASIAGTVYEDTNNNGVQDTDEPGIPGASVTLNGTDPSGAIAPVTLTTGPDGEYLFEDLLGGDYTVTEVTPTGYLDGTDADGSTGGTATNPGDAISGISLDPDEDATDHDFGEIVPGSISGNVRDENGDPIGGVTITLTGTDDQGDITPIIITTEPDGSYVFPDLRPGTYTVTETQPDGFGEGGESTPDAGGTTTTNVVSGLTVGQGTSNDGNDFVETYSSIAGTVYVDVNDNGVQDAGEPGIPGASVTLNGTDPNGAITEVTIATGPDGSYLFPDLLSGDYIVTEVTPAAFDDGTDVAGSVGGTAVNPGDEINSIPLPVGTDAVDYDFGEIGTILSGTVYVDDNRDGAIGPGEDARVGGVTIILLDDNGDEVARTTTAPDGTYIFVGLGEGDYTVVQEQPTEYGTTTVNTLDVTVPKEGLTDVDFGEDLGSIGNFVFRDLDGDGVQDADEPGVAGVQVQLRDLDGNLVGEATSGTDGSYLFDRLFPGDYVVTFLPADGDAITEPGQGDAETGSDPDWVTGTTSTVTLGIDADTGLVDRRTDVDAGIVEEVIDLAITAAIDKTSVRLGDKVVYTFTPTNNSTVPVVDGARVVLVLPPLVTVDQVVAPGWVVSVNGNEVTLILDQVLLPGDPLPPITVDTTVVSATGSPDATAVIGTVNSDTETTLANNSDSVTLGVITIDLPATGSDVTRLLLQYSAFFLMVGAILGLLARRRKTSAVITI